MTNASEFEEFMRNYQNMVFSTAVRLLGNEPDACDISQEVFLKAYERFAELSTATHPGGWLKTVTRNLCLNHLTRYRGRWRFFSEMSTEDDDSYVDSLAAEPVEYEGLDEAQKKMVLDEALQKLPEHQRIPLVLYHFEDLSYEQIAEQLKVSLGKVKTDIHRARHALKRRLQMKAGLLQSGNNSTI